MKFVIISLIVIYTSCNSTPYNYEISTIFILDSSLDTMISRYDIKDKVLTKLLKVDEFHSIYDSANKYIYDEFDYDGHVIRKFLAKNGDRLHISYSNVEFFELNGYLLAQIYLEYVVAGNASHDAYGSGILFLFEFKNNKWQLVKVHRKPQ